MNRLVLALMVAGLVTLWSSPANACSCGTAGVCDAAWTADAVFVGHVVSIESSPTGGRMVQLALLEGFRGFRLTQVAVTTSGSEASCGYPFQIGESYVVFAHQAPENGALTVSLCSRTRPVASAAEDLAYLRSLTSIAPGTRARVAGQVLLSQSSPAAGRQPEAMSGIAVTARGKGITFSARSDARGNFVLTGLTVGTYEVEATAPGGYASIARPLEIRDPRGCGSTVVYLRYDGRVSGRVVDARGAGIAALPLDLVLRAESNRPEGGRARVRTRTAADGTFELRLVEPGEYLLGFNFLRTLDNRPLTEPGALYPGVTDLSSAGAIVVAAGQRARLRNFTIADTVRLTTLTGTVVDEAGRPMRNVSVSIGRDTEGGGDSVGPPLVTGADGRFAFTVAEAGGRYFVRANWNANTGGGARDIYYGNFIFTAAPGLGDGEATIVMKPSVPVPSLP